MNRLFICICVSAFLLIGCEGEDYTLLSDMTIESTEPIEASCAINCYKTIVLSKGGEEIKLRVQDDSMFESLIEGTTVTVTYDHNFYVQKVSFPNLETKREVPPELRTGKQQNEE